VLVGRRRGRSLRRALVPLISKRRNQHQRRRTRQEHLTDPEPHRQLSGEQQAEHLRERKHRHEAGAGHLVRFWLSGLADTAGRETTQLFDSTDFISVFPLCFQDTVAQPSHDTLARILLHFG